MSTDPLEHARALAADGRHDEAIRVAWRKVMPMVVSNDHTGLAAAAEFARGISDQTQGTTSADANQLATYCTACLESERESLFDRWSLSNMFSRRRRNKRCPDCAEYVAAEAHVCRYCGYRFGDPPPGDLYRS